MINSCKTNKMKHIELNELKIIIEKNNVKLKSLNEVESFLS